MKIFSALVIAALLLHVQCGDSCLVDSLHAKAPEPPCHKHAETPVKDHAPAHENNSVCSERSVIGSAVFQVLAILPVDTAALLPVESVVARLTVSKPPDLHSSNFLTSVRRI
jgi:hypothetical protein